MIKYNRLFMTLAERGIEKSDLLDIMTYPTLKKLKDNKYVSLQVIDDICCKYKISPNDVFEVVYDVDMCRKHCNWHLPEREAISEHVFMVVKPYDRYELVPKKQ